MTEPGPSGSRPGGVLGRTPAQLAARSQDLATVELVPPNVDPDYPDYDYVREFVGAALVLSTAETDEG